MSLLKCQSGIRQGWKFGATGKCFVGPDSRSKAVKQGRSIQASTNRNDAVSPALLRIQRRQAQGIKKPKRRLPKKLPVWLHPDPPERKYQKSLLEYIDSLTEIINRMIVPNLKSLIDERNLEVPIPARSDDFADSLARLFSATTLAFENEPTNKTFIAATAGNDTNEWNDKEWDKQMKAAFGVSITQREPFINPALNGFVRENVESIDKMTADYLGGVRSTVQKQVRSGASISTITTELQKQENITKNKARFLARDRVGRFNGELTGYRQTNLGVTNYIWRDSDDRRVRPHHRSKDGKTFSWAEPPADTGHPGDDYQCRCYAEADFTQIFQELAA